MFPSNLSQVRWVPRPSENTAVTGGGMNRNPREAAKKFRSLPGNIIVKECVQT